MAEARNLTNAERCSLFLLDPEQEDLVAKVFDGVSTRDVSNIAKDQSRHNVNSNFAKRLFDSVEAVLMLINKSQSLYSPLRKCG